MENEFRQIQTETFEEEERDRERHSKGTEV